MAASSEESRVSGQGQVGEEEDDILAKMSTLAVVTNSPDSSSTQESSTQEPEEVRDTDIIAVPSGDTLYSTATRFEDLKLSEELLVGLFVEMRFKRPSQIQSVTLPMILTPPYKNLIAQAHNGCGKTTCFVLGMLSRIDPNVKAPQALCMCPTRELAIQNIEVLRKMGKHTGISSFLLVKGTKMALAISDQVVIGTPGSIKRGVTYKNLSTRQMRMLVFDEADHMLSDDGFRDDSLRILKDIGKNSAHCQVLLFSATFNDPVKDFVSKQVIDANQIFVKKEELSLDVVKQYKVNCPDELAKIALIREKIFELGEKLGQTIIFVRTKESASALHKALGEYGYGCTAVSSNLENSFRDKIIKEFKDGLTQVLISTDVLARGFDQSQVNLVINFNIPAKYNSPSEPDYEVYLHRCGRVGRFGRKGAVFNLLCTESDYILMNKIQDYFGHEIAEVPNWESEEHIEKALRSAGLL